MPSDLLSTPEIKIHSCRKEHHELRRGLKAKAQRQTKQRVTRGQHSTMVGMLGFRPSCHGFDSQCSQKFFR